MIEQPGSRRLRTWRSRDSRNTAEVESVSRDSTRITSLGTEEAREVPTDTMMATRPWRRPDTSQSVHQERLKEDSAEEWVTECWRREMPD